MAELDPQLPLEAIPLKHMAVKRLVEIMKKHEAEQQDRLIKELRDAAVISPSAAFDSSNLVKMPDYSILGEIPEGQFVHGILPQKLSPEAIELIKAYQRNSK
jgi:hypothetical protein